MPLGCLYVDDHYKNFLRRISVLGLPKVSMANTICSYFVLVI